MILPIILSAASLIAWGFSFIFFKNYLRRRTDPEWILSEWKEEINKLNADMDATTDRNVALVEDRIKSLKELIKDVDRRIALSVREEDKRRTQEAAYAALGRRTEYTKFAADTGIAVNTGITADTKLAVNSGSAADPKLAVNTGSAADAGPQTGYGETDRNGPSPVEVSPASPSPAAPPMDPPPVELPLGAVSGLAFPEEPPPGPRFVRSSRPVEPKPPSFAERVAELSKAGFSASMIAANLGVPLAEVDLAIAIAERKNPL